MADRQSDRSLNELSSHAFGQVSVDCFVQGDLSMEGLSELAHEVVLHAQRALVTASRAKDESLLARRYISARTETSVPNSASLDRRIGPSLDREL